MTTQTTTSIEIPTKLLPTLVDLVARNRWDSNDRLELWNVIEKLDE